MALIKRAVRHDHLHSTHWLESQLAAAILSIHALICNFYKL